MNDMLKSRPLLLLVVTLCLVVVALASFWLAALPKRMLASLQHGLTTQRGLNLEASNPQLSFADGIALQLENVSLVGKDENSISLSAQHMRVVANVATLFGASVSAQDIVFTKAVVAVDVSKPFDLALPIGGTVKIVDSAVRLRDDISKSVVALSDMNGEFSGTVDGSSKVLATFLLGERLSTLTADFENTARLNTDGSPADIMLSSKDLVLTFSGRAKLANGFELVGQSAIEANEAAALMRWLGMPLSTLEGAGGFKLQSGITVQGLSVALEKVTGKIGVADVTGTLKVAAGADRMKLAGDIEVSRIAAFGPKVDGSIFAMPWSEQPLPLADARAIEYDLKVKAAALVLRGRDLGPLSFKLIADGTKTLLGIEQQPFIGGQIKGNLAFEGNNKQPVIIGTMDASGVDAQKFLGGLFGLDALSGPVNIVTNFASEGRHVAALVSSLKGDMEFHGKNVTVNGVDLQNALSNSSEGWGGASTPALQLKVVATINEGVMLTGPSDIKAAEMTLKPKGEIDLLRQVFELQLQPKGNGADPKMTLTGQWNRPMFSNTIAVKEKPALTPPAN